MFDVGAAESCWKSLVDGLCFRAIPVPAGLLVCRDVEAFSAGGRGMARHPSCHSRSHPARSFPSAWRAVERVFALYRFISKKLSVSGIALRVM
jgi:hypothetical protein